MTYRIANQADASQEWADALALYQDISGYQDADQKAADCELQLRQIEIERRRQ